MCFKLFTTAYAARKQSTRQCLKYLFTATTTTTQEQEIGYTLFVWIKKGTNQSKHTTPPQPPSLIHTTTAMGATYRYMLISFVVVPQPSTHAQSPRHAPSVAGGTGHSVAGTTGHAGQTTGALHTPRYSLLRLRRRPPSQFTIEIAAPGKTTAVGGNGRSVQRSCKKKRTQCVSLVP